MLQPANIDIRADRWVACSRTFAFVDIVIDPATAVLNMAIRITPDATGSPLVLLSTVASLSAEGVVRLYSGTDTIANHIAAGRLSAVPQGYTEASSILVSQIGILINAATMQALPFPSERGDDMTLYWDMLITPVTAGFRDKYMGGKFIVAAGVTTS